MSSNRAENVSSKKSSVGESLRGYQDTRLIGRVLTLYYEENITQSKIGTMLNLSSAKVNRLLKFARSQGMVEIKINLPNQHVFELERQLENITGVKKAIVVPRLVDLPDAILKSVGQVAADYLVENLNDGDTICVGGGRTIGMMVQMIPQKRAEQIKVVPFGCGVQGRHETDVNNLADGLAKILGGASLQLHAPAFTDTAQEREALVNLRQVKEVMDIARAARIMVFSVGTLEAKISSFYKFTSLSESELLHVVEKRGGVGEVLAHVLNKDGKPCMPEYDSRIVGLDLEDLKKIPIRFCVAALENKALPVAAALRGGLITMLVIDDVTAKKVLELF